MAYYTDIEMEVKRRGITRLCHFTPSRKFAHIISNERGILCTDILEEEAADIMDVTDKLRLDGHKECISCSIQYPNTWYLRTVKDRDPLFNDWVVLFIKPKYIWLKGTLFCCRNASAKGGALIGEGVSAFENLFSSIIIGARGKTFTRTPKMLDCCPTDDQAEVLVPENITRENILAVAVQNEDQAKKEIIRISLIDDSFDITWIVAPKLFSVEWSGLVRVGKYPQEIIYSK